MNIIICDDRIDDRKNLSDLLSDYGEKKNYEFAITEYDSGEQLCEEQSALEACQILFLDINMQGMDGLKTAMRIKEKYPKLPVVLVTAYMNYALDGYKVKASRFLLKDNLADTIEECMDDLIAEINKNRRILEFRFVEGTIKLYADDIIYIETELHKNVFYTEKGTFQIYKKLDELENEFKDMGFVRAHLSFLVNELNQIGIKIDYVSAGVQIYSCFRLYSGGLTCSTPHIFPLHFPHFLVCGNIHNPDIGIVNVDLLCPFPVLFLTLMDYDFIHKCV